MNIGNLDLHGSIKIDIKRANGDTESTGWFDNLITSYGKDHLALGKVVNWIYLGDGNDDPTVSDSALSNYLHYVYRDSITSRLVTNNDESYSRITTLKFVIEASEIGKNFNLTELGLAANRDPLSNTLITHSKIKDTLNNPTSLSITTKDTLIIYYQLEYKAKIVNFEQEVQIPKSSSENGRYKFSVLRNKRWIEYHPVQTLDNFNTILGYDGGTRMRGSPWRLKIIEKPSNIETDSLDSIYNFSENYIISDSSDYVKLIVDSGVKYLEISFDIKRETLDQLKAVNELTTSDSDIVNKQKLLVIYPSEPDKFSSFYMTIEDLDDNTKVLTAETGNIISIKFRIEIGVEE